MKTYKYILILMLAVMPSIVAHAQIGYQVSLLNSATGQPRAGETVTVGVKLTNSENATVYTTQQKATSNDFGVLSLSIGDAETFEELDWNKLPLYIEVSIDGVLIAKSQVLSVPVAEYAKKSGLVLTKEFLTSRSWEVYSSLGKGSIVFGPDGVSIDMIPGHGDFRYVLKGKYQVLNDKVVIGNLSGQCIEYGTPISIPNGKMCVVYDPIDSSFIEIGIWLEYEDLDSGS